MTLTPLELTPTTTRLPKRTALLTGAGVAAALWAPVAVISHISWFSAAAWTLVVGGGIYLALRTMRSARWAKAATIGALIGYGAVAISNLFPFHWSPWAWATIGTAGFLGYSTVRAGLLRSGGRKALESGKKDSRSDIDKLLAELEQQ